MICVNGPQIACFWGKGESLAFFFSNGIQQNNTPINLKQKNCLRLVRILTDNVKGNIYRINKLANCMGFTHQLTAAVSVVSPPQNSKQSDQRLPCLCAVLVELSVWSLFT